MWFGLTSTLLLLCFTVASAVPVFEDMTGLIGSVLIPVLQFCVPPLLYARSRLQRALPIASGARLVMGTLLLFGIALTVVGTAATSISISASWKAEHIPGPAGEGRQDVQAQAHEAAWRGSGAGGVKALRLRGFIGHG